MILDFCMNCSFSSAPSGHLVALDQQRLQSGDFCAQLSDQPHVAVLVDGGLVDDVLGSVGVSQSAERLAVVHVGGGDRCEENVNRMTSNISVSLEEFECRRVARRSLLTGDHDGLGVSAQTVFQQPRQHRVSVGDEHRLLLQVGVHAVLRHVSWTHTGNTSVNNNTHTHTSMNASKPTVVLRLSPREEMTLPRVTSDLLMFPPSFSRTPVAPVASARSLPARSTRWILLTVSLGISASNLA